MTMNSTPANTSDFGVLPLVFSRLEQLGVNHFDFYPGIFISAGRKRNCLEEEEIGNT